MNKFIVKILLFAICCFVIDQSFGVALRFLASNARSGQTQKNEEICNRTFSEILVLGSSRAVHHYNPLILQDTLGMTCYNCGYDGCGSITAYGLLKILMERYSPKCVIYEVTPSFDYLLADKDNSRYLGPLRLYYDHGGIETLFCKVNSAEPLKMKSYMYRMNSKLIQMVSENIMNRNETQNGFFTKDEIMMYEPDIKAEKAEFEYDSLKIECLKGIIGMCKAKNIQLIFVASPAYGRTSDLSYKYMKEFAFTNGCVFINHYKDGYFVNNKSYFYDSSHMNRKGATEYSKMIAHELANIFK